MRTPPSTEEYEGRILLLRDTLQIALGFLESLDGAGTPSASQSRTEATQAQSLAERVVRVLNDTR